MHVLHRARLQHGEGPRLRGNDHHAELDVLGSFEKMRSSLIGSKSILSMLHQGPRAFDAIGGEVVNVTADVVYNARAACGAPTCLVDINGSEAKRQKALEAIRNPDCGWFYRREPRPFKQIPGTPSPTGQSDGLLSAMADGVKLSSFGRTSKGIITGKNDKFIRLWWECAVGTIGFRHHLYPIYLVAENGTLHKRRLLS